MRSNHVIIVDILIVVVQGNEEETEILVGYHTKVEGIQDDHEVLLQRDINLIVTTEIVE